MSLTRRVHLLELELQTRRTEHQVQMAGTSDATNDNVSRPGAEDAEQIEYTPAAPVAAIKKPPRETSTEILQRRLVIVSFWAVVLLLGLPIWWKTTTVYRANLPLQLMADWADDKVCIEIRLDISSNCRSGLQACISSAN